MESKDVCKRITIEIPQDLRFVPKEFLLSWKEGGFVERHPAIEVWHFIQRTVEDELCPGMCLTGPMGAGKSSTMLLCST
jgi:hypothetical protein